MVKSKAKTSTSVPNKSVHLRLAYLHQAARYLKGPTTSSKSGTVDHDVGTGDGVRSAQSRLLCNHIKTISKRAVIRLDKSVKRKICKGCDSLLLDAHDAVKHVENDSRHGLTASASVEVVQCRVCGRRKRFPVSVRQADTDARATGA